ncbi:PQQ-binding-like beta-propeller repeat protein [Muricauda sp. JGD-17]|uniref:PQQ-binding-like beta-propeller repeat protein n=1 Tax=Flagellimonas ochracea TaxID=2696472 RepID=A0A964T8M4_9FLAO|nr:PQQ-binding-like beta-propeller repeat protein [Allomuricauda ochracea]NAY90290.1 PQQ-binding-like beta-propeller repeat protein [Allomuricauda ochracea]
MTTNQLALIALLVLSIKVNSQKNITVYTNDKKEIGTNLISHVPILATEYVFPERVNDFQMDTLSNHIALEIRGLSNNGKWLKNKGYTLRYDAVKQKVLWSEKVNYQLENIEQFEGITLRTKGGKTFCIDNDTAEELWEVRNSILFVDQTKKIALGYRLATSNKDSEILEGIDLRNGNVVWERFITREYGWNDIYRIDESNLMIVAGGIHTLNINDGTGWDYYTKTGKKDYTSSTIGTGLGIVAGLLTGTYAASTGHDLVRDVSSNVIEDSLNLYFASNEHFTKLDKKGSIKWQIKLPDDKTSKSQIFKKEEELFVVNKGYAYLGYRKLDVGTPFVACFDRETGGQKYLIEVGEKKDDNINAMDIDGNNLILIFPNRISKFDLESGQLIESISFSEVAFGGLNNFIGEHVYIEKNSRYTSLPKTDLTKYYVLTNKHKILVLDSELKPENEIDTNDVYLYYLKWNDYNFLSKENGTIIIDGEGQKIAKITVNKNSKLIGSKLYSVSDKSLFVIDLNQIIDGKP